jgi:hypothetical protein
MEEISIHFATIKEVEACLNSENLGVHIGVHIGV